MDDDTPPIYQLVYASRATRPLSEAELGALLEVSRAHNERVDVSGILLYDGGDFLQVLEGPRSSVQDTFDRISQDDRHTDALVLSRRTVDERAFEGWSMGFARASFQLIDVVDGWSDFLRTGRSGDTEGHERVWQLLEGFRQGRWRRSA